MNNKYLPIAIWAGLGFARGIEHYGHRRSGNIKILDQNESYMYINSIAYGICGSCIYSNPILLPFTGYNELYNLEVYIRDLK